MNHPKRLTINQRELANWIHEVAQEAVMLTISRPSASAQALLVQAEHMEPIVSQIIQRANGYVFGKHKRFEFLSGLVVQEGGHCFPHFHIVFQKPIRMEMDLFMKKLTQLANRISTLDFEFDLRDSRLSSSYRAVLKRPGYPAFAHASLTHDRLGSYLTAEPAKYYELMGRDFNLERDLIDLRVDFHNTQPTTEAA